MYCHVFRVLHFHIFFLHFKLSCAIALKRWKRYDSGSFYRWADKNYGLDENRGWCKSTLPLCHSNPDRFLNECYPGCSGCMPGRLAYRSLPSYSSTRLFFRGFSSNRDKKYASPSVFFFARRRRGSNSIEHRMLELLFAFPILSFFR